MSANKRKTEWTTHRSCSMIVPIEPLMDQAFISSDILPEKQQKQNNNNNNKKAMDSVPVQINYFLTVLIWGAPWASWHPLIPSGDMNMWLFSATLHLTPSPVFMLCNTGPQIAMWDWYTHTQSSKRYLMLLWFDEHAAFFFFFFFNAQGHNARRKRSVRTHKVTPGSATPELGDGMNQVLAICDQEDSKHCEAFALLDSITAERN